jgi:hypothetical protein
LNDLKDGPGTYTWANGESEEGKWVKGEEEVKEKSNRLNSIRKAYKKHHHNNSTSKT